MTFQPLIIPSILAAAALISVSIAAKAWKNRASRSSYFFFLLSSVNAFWCLATMFENILPGEELKMGAVLFEYVCLTTVPILLLLTVLNYIKPRYYTFWQYALLFIIPVITVVLMATYRSHNFVYFDIYIKQINGIDILQRKQGAWYFVNVVYTYGALLLSMFLLVKYMLKSYKLFRKQLAFVGIAIIIPWISNSLYLLGDTSFFPYDLTSASLSLSGLMLHFANFRHKLFDIIPAARDQVFESIPQGVIVLNPNGDIIDINVSGAYLLGHKTKEELIGKSSDIVFGDFPKIKTSLHSYTNLTAEFCVLGKAIELSVSPLSGKNGKIFGSVIVMNDLSARKKMETELADTNEQLAYAMEASSDGLWDYRMQSHTAYLSPRYYAMLGYTADEWQPTFDNFLDIIHPEDRGMLLAQLEPLRRNETNISNIEIRMRAKNGSYRWIHSRGKIVERNENREPLRWIGTNTDITEQKELEQELRNSRTHLEEMNAAKDKFFSIIAHDLKNPFGAIIGFSELLLDKDDPLTEDERTKMLESLRQAAESTLRLLENLLHWSRSQVGTLPVNLAELNVLAMYEEVYRMLRYGAEMKGVVLRSDIPKGLTVTADEEMLRTILRNLITNAIKFTPQGGTVTVAGGTTERGVQISVRDTGIGMDDETKKNLFRIDRTTTTPGTDGEQGTGLGLILCKEFAGKCGGKLTFESTLGEGTVFMVELKG